MMELMISLTLSLGSFLHEDSLQGWKPGPWLSSRLLQVLAFPPASVCLREWNVRVNCRMCLCTRRPAEREATIHSCFGLQSCDSWVLRETFCALSKPQLSHSSGYFKTNINGWASGKLTTIHQMLCLNVIYLACLWGWN